MARAQDDGVIGLVHILVLSRHVQTAEDKNPRPLGRGQGEGGTPAFGSKPSPDPSPSTSFG